MLCDDCQERPATVHVTKITNGQKKQSHLCEICANHDEQINFSLKPFGFFELINGLVTEGQSKSALTSPYIKTSVCKECGTQYDQISQNGLLGCACCYEAFHNNLEGIIKRIHGSTKHTGKIPNRAGKGFQVKRKLENLKAELNSLVAKEAFEQAAVIRDEIRSLESKLRAGGESHDHK